MNVAHKQLNGYDFPLTCKFLIILDSKSKFINLSETGYDFVLINTVSANGMFCNELRSFHIFESYIFATCSDKPKFVHKLFIHAGGNQAWYCTKD